MAVIMVVEDGTGLSNSNSYLTIAELKQYWDNSGYDYSALTDDDEISVLLIKNTRAIDGQYNNKWPGTRGSSTQALGWPRTGATYLDGYAIDSDEVPDEVKAAVSESAYMDDSGTNPQPVDDKNNIKQYSVTVEGAVAESTTYGDATGSARPESTAVKDALSRLVRSRKYGGAAVVRI